MIYVDDITYHGKKGKWCHMAIDSGAAIEQLHRFAARIGLKREWFQPHDAVPHYDLRPSKRELAIKNGAIALTSVDMFKKCNRREERLRDE